MLRPPLPQVPGGQVWGAHAVRLVDGWAPGGEMLAREVPRPVRVPPREAGGLHGGQDHPAAGDGAGVGAPGQVPPRAVQDQRGHPPTLPGEGARARLRGRPARGESHRGAPGVDGAAPRAEGRPQGREPPAPGGREPAVAGLVHRQAAGASVCGGGSLLRHEALPAGGKRRGAHVHGNEPLEGGGAPGRRHARGALPGQQCDP